MPYKGTAPAFQDLIGGQIDGFIDPMLGSVQFHKSGQLRVVAVTSASALPNLPDVPTVGRDAAGLRVLQLVRPVGAGEAAGRRSSASSNAAVNKALAGDMREQAARRRACCSTPRLARTTSRSSRRDDMAASQKIITEGNIRVE